MKDAACIILSGGLSERMGSHKALLSYADQENFLQHIIRVYSTVGINNIVVVLNPNIDFDQLSIDNSPVTTVINSFPERGRLYSLQLGLSVASSVSHCFIQNIDNPFVNNDLLNQLYNFRSEADCIKPSYLDQGGHPILISSKIVSHILDLKSYTSTLREVLSNFNNKKIQANKDCVVNMNSMNDYHTYFSL
ncbi:MAG: NTP transferase domain-containing protein [Bacteroidota bacterium]